MKSRSAIQLMVMTCLHELSWVAAADQLLYSDVSIETVDGVEFGPIVLVMAKYGDSIILTTLSGIWKLDPITKTRELIAGSEMDIGYVDGVGEAARLNMPAGITIAGDKAVVSEITNHCLREIDLITKVVTTIAGVCKMPGYQNGPANQAKFGNPTGIIEYQSGILIADASNNAVRLLSEDNNVSTPTQRPIRNPQYLIELGGYIYVTCTTGLIKLDSRNGWVQELIAGSSFETSFRDGDFQSALFSSPTVAISPAPGLLLVTDFRNNKIRMLNLTSEMVYSICSGDNGARDGRGDVCTLASPRAMMVYDYQTTYFSQMNIIRKLSHSFLGEVTNKTGFRRISAQRSKTGKGSRCLRSEATGVYQSFALYFVLLISTFLFRFSRSHE